MAHEPISVVIGEKTISIPTEDEDERAEERGQWIRAAILGANDGLLSTTSLMLGIGAAKEDRWSMVLSGLAGAIAGACSMAVGEFVSVSTQRDIEEKAAHSRRLRISETTQLQQNLNSSLPLTTVPSPSTKTHNIQAAMSPDRRSQIMSPGRSPMMKVIAEDTNTKPIESKMKDEQGFEGEGEAPLPLPLPLPLLPSPTKAASASAFAFLCGSVVPLVSGMLVNDNKTRIVVITLVTSIALAVFGAIGAHLGGSKIKVSAARVLLGGWMAMAISYGLLKPFDDKGTNKTDED